VEPFAIPLQSFLPPGFWARAERASITRGDTAAARRLLAEAGLARGIAPKLLLAGAAPPLDQARLGEAVGAALGAAGMAVAVGAEPPEAAFRQAQQGEHELVLVETLAEAGDPHLLLYPLSTSEGAARGPAAWNLAFYRNPRLDEMLIRASQLSFRPERQRVYGRAQGLLAEELPWIPLYVRLHWAVARPEVRNLRLHPSGQHRLDRVSLDPALPPARP
jgi:peptide/nickel transport system substrate-binding protein